MQDLKYRKAKLSYTSYTTKDNSLIRKIRWDLDLQALTRTLALTIQAWVPLESLLSDSSLTLNQWTLRNRRATFTIQSICLRNQLLCRRALLIPNFQTSRSYNWWILTFRRTNTLCHPNCNRSSLIKLSKSRLLIR